MKIFSSILFVAIFDAISSCLRVFCLFKSDLIKALNIEKYFKVYLKYMCIYVLPVIIVPTNNDTDTNIFPASAPYSVVILPLNVYHLWIWDKIILK